MNQPADHTALELAEADLCARLSRQLASLNLDPDADIAQLGKAEATLNDYLQAVATGQSALPDRRAIAWACLMLLLIGDDFTPDDYSAITHLYTADIPLSPHDVAPQIQRIRDRIIGKFERKLGISGAMDPSMDGPCPA